MILADPGMEARVVLSLITEPFAKEQCADLSLDDVTDFRVKTLLEAYRNLDTAGLPCGIEDIVSAIRVRDRQYGTNRSEHVTWFWLGEQMCIASPYRGESLLLGYDLGRLRDLANQRRRLA